MPDPFAGTYEDPESPPPEDEVGPGESQSVINGIERVRRPNSDSSETTLGRSHTFRQPGAQRTRNIVMDEWANKSLPPERTDFRIQQLEKRADSGVRRSYANGIALPEVVESAKKLTVGMTFLPGADKAQVNRIEQISMENNPPDQKDANWRVTTAGSLLVQFLVTEDLQVIQTDNTANILKKVRKREKESDRVFSDQRKALALRGRNSDVVTIDSENVTLVNDLRTGTWDIQGLLVEVDETSLWDLIMNYRTLIARGGPEMTFDETRDLLETMIEDARRLCIRSPILFRMSTRGRIMNAADIRYGINHGPMFRTLTTSKGIKEIISLSAGYYNSLDPNGSTDKTQSFVKPRFLQMLALLLSLLNDRDLFELQDFLEATYKIKADRHNIELLILKVIPLLSINPRVFLRGLVPSVEGFPLSSDGDTTNRDERHSDIWNIFVQRLLSRGYILPGNVTQLGRVDFSWIVKWPEDGFKSTSIFNTLQYGGPLRGINAIPPIEMNPGADCSELTIVMNNDQKYIISPKDLENITLMTPGDYPLQEAAQGRRFFNLTIQETPLNGELYQALKLTNDLVSLINQSIASPKRSSGALSKFVRKAPTDQPFMNEARGTGRLVEVFATVNQTTLAVAYKVEGRKVRRFDAIQNMARDIRHLRAFIAYIERRGDIADRGFFSSDKREWKQCVENVKAQIDLAEQSRLRIGSEIELSNDPVAKCLYPEGSNPGEADVWNDYQARSRGNNGYLEINARKSTVATVRWLSDELIELSLSQQPSKLVVTPLHSVAEGYRDDEVRVEDIAILVGQYVAIAELDENSYDSSGPYLMTNFLRIVSKEEQTQSRRRMNRTQQSDAKVRCLFK